MRRILAIFTKDAAHLWPHAAVFGALLLAWVLAEQASDGRNLRTLIHALTQVACWFLVIAAIHTDRVLGHNEYWLTRPLTWRDLIAAKALFATTFVALPFLLFQIAALAAAGVRPLDDLPAQLWRTLFFAVLFILAPAAIAAVTKGLAQTILATALLALLLGVAAGILGGILGPTSWGPLAWIPSAAIAAVVSAGCLTVLSIQYSRRRTALARSVLAVTSLLAIVIAVLPPWGPAFAIQAARSTERVDNSAIRILFDPRPPASNADKVKPAWDVYGARLEIPVRVDNVPQGLSVVSDWTAVSVESWRSGWSDYPALHDDKGAMWLTLYIDQNLFNRLRNTPVDVTVVSDLTLVSRVATLREPDLYSPVPGVGFCGSTLYCSTPFARVSLRRQRTGETPRGALFPDSYAPFPTSFAFDPVRTQPLSFSYDGTVWDLPNTSVAVEKPVAHIQRTLTLHNLKLGDYAVWR